MSILNLGMKKYLLLLLVLNIVLSCQKKMEVVSSTFFEALSKEKSGIVFLNNIIENDTLNYTTFPYMYMGGGVSIGDINNDGLSDIYFTGNMSQNKLYLNKGNMNFEDITDDAGVSGDDRWYTGVTMADVNNDGWLDIYVCVSGQFTKTNNQLFINNKDNTFTDMAVSYGLDDASKSIQSTFFDYDSDGYLDVFVGNYPTIPVTMGNLYYHDKMVENKFEDSGHLYKNNGDDTFTDVTEKSGLQNFGLTLGILASDFNNDGWQDLYLSNDFNVPDYFYLNNGNGTFKEVIKEATNHTSMFGMGIDGADFNNDGLLDILQLDMTPNDYKRSKTNMASMSPTSFYQAVDLGMHYQYMQNSLQVNNGIDVAGIPVFSDISRFADLATTDWSWGCLFADFDNDGLKDIIITNGMKRDVNNNDVNNKTTVKTFVDENKAINYKDYPSVPIDNYVFKNIGDYKFSKVNEAWGLSYKGFSNGVSYGDLDNDGDLDIVINNLSDVASVFENGTDGAISQNYLKVKLVGPESNPFGLGARVTIKTSMGQQFQELTLSRGFQSSVEPILHFGIGKELELDSVEVLWPNGSKQLLKDVSANKELEFLFKDADVKVINHESKPKVFEDITNKLGINFTHTEDVYDDFLNEPLLPHKNSRFGPGLAVGDVNGDGLEDFFVGNAAGSSATMYMQNSTGNFETIKGPWEQDFTYEDTGALLFDADNDSDLDLYVVSGGNDPSKPNEFYQDRLYLNTKDGFVKSKQTLPKIISSGFTVISEDYDGDGDLDLFVGGRIIPGKYPFPAKSYILRNDGGKDLSLKFTDVTDAVLPVLNEAGLVTSALWDDFDQDGKIDLIITGEWMSIRFFKNIGNSFEEVTRSLGFENHTGWWYSLQKADIDGDGDMDYLAGNLGLNYKYKATKEAPFEVYANDFDENGTSDIVLSYKKHGQLLPLRGRECSSQQVPAIKRRFETFELFADATLADIYGQAMLDKSLHYQAKTFANSWVENNGNGSYELHKLPNKAQLSSINAFEKLDLKTSAGSRFLTVGNLYQSEVETPRNDGSIGMVIESNSKGNYSILDATATGLFITGEIRNVQTIRLGTQGQLGVLFARNDDSLKLFSINAN
jgi:hypothetical protein